MTLEYRDPSTDGLIQMIYNESQFQIRSFDNDEKDTLTIAWNRGENRKVIIDDEEITFEEDKVMVLNSGQSFYSNDSPEIVFWRFSRKFYCIVDHDHEVSCVGLLFYGHKEIPNINLEKDDYRKLSLLFNVFREEYDEPDDNLKSEMLRIILKRLIVKLTRIYKKQVDLESLEDSDMDLIRNFNLMVEKNFRKFHQVQDYADLVHKSPKTISNLFSKYGSKSPLEVIHERLILEAKRLLLYTDKTTKEISYEIGFRDIPGFSRFFKKHTQLSPSEYRKEQVNLKEGKN